MTQATNAITANNLLNGHIGDSIDKKHRDRILAGCARFVAANKSDPFAGRRVAAHIKNGIGVHYDKQGNPESYDAERSLETRTLQSEDGTYEYKVEVYTNICRP